jgi:5-formyltetrahydrofolate cyclo-ligase
MLIVEGLTKQEIRQRARHVRSSLTCEEVASFSRIICESARRKLDNDDPVMVYASKPPEVVTTPLIIDLLGSGKRVVLPIIEKETRSLRLSYLEDPACLVPSTFSVPEPIGNEIPAEGKDLKVVVLPLLAFDRKGHRLGYGAGDYDRFLSRFPDAVRIGMAFSCQEAPRIPAEECDMAMDMVITERETIRCGR